MLLSSFKYCSLLAVGASQDVVYVKNLQDTKQVALYVKLKHPARQKIETTTHIFICREYLKLYAENIYMQIL
jgi:hypothetical protein